MKKYLSWLDNNLIAIIAGLLIVFIPLYPKLPLFDALPGYLVRVRAEDFFVLIACIIFAVQLVRRKISLTLSPITIGIVSYLIVGLLSVAASVYISHTVPDQFLHIAKTMLHWLRRIEYFSLFFIFFGTIKSWQIVKAYLGLMFVTLIGVIIYGYGQKYLYWYAYSTMNREFAKGIALVLSQHARVQSTFGGHYDLAGYLVITLSLAWSFFFGLKTLWQKVIVGIGLAGGFWLLILTASRISFGAYILGLAVVSFLWSFKKGWKWGLSRGFVAIFLSIVIMLSFGDLSDRFLRLIKVSDRVQGLQQLVLGPAVAPPKSKNVLFLDNTTVANVTSESDQPPTPVVPADVNSNEPQMLIATYSATGVKTLVPKARTYSQCALVLDLSTCIRFESTWPQAINGFKIDPLFGSGYATLTKTYVDEFTEAESTDNDYLRALGETGALGFLTFFGTLIFLIYYVFKRLGGIKDTYLYALCVGFIAALVGLLANATLIDIFESSKVAYVFWALTGITLGSLYLFRQKIKDDMEPLRLNINVKQAAGSVVHFFKSPLFWVLILCFLTLSLRLYKFESPIADWHSWRQADTSAVTRNFVRNNKIDWLTPVYDDLSSIASGKDNPKGYRFVEFPIYNAFSFTLQKMAVDLPIEAAGRIMTAIMSAFSTLFLFLLVKKMFGNRAGFLSALVFAVLPYNIYYGRVVLPDPTLVTFSLASLYFSLMSLDRKRIHNLVLSTLFASLAFLIKPSAVFLIAPVLYFFLVNFRFNFRKWLVPIAIMALSLAPFVLWRILISQHPEGIPASDWLFNGDGIRFKGAFWYWIFADRIGRLILGYWGLVLLGFGLVRKLEGKYKLFPLLFALCSILYLVLIATGNVRHDYYQILIIPALSVLVGLGLDFMLFEAPKLTQLTGLTRVLALVSFVFMLAFGWYYVKDYYNINHPEIIEAGNKVRDLTDWRSLVVAPYDGDTAFLYQTDRRGWPIMEGSIDDMIGKGAQYYVSVRLDDQLTKDLINDSWPVGKLKPSKIVRKYKLLAQTDRYVVIQLVPDKDLPQK